MQQVIDIVAQVRGADEIKNLAAVTAWLNEKILELGPHISATDPRMVKLAEGLLKVRAEAAALKERLNPLPPAIDKTSEAMERTITASNAQIKALGMLADRLDTVGTHGIKGLLRSLGTLHPALLLVGVGIDLLTRHWDEIQKLWSEGSTETEAERMEKLEKATHRTVEETKELNKYKKEQAGIEKLQNENSAKEKSDVDKINKAVAEVGGKAAIDAVTNSLNQLEADTNAHFGAEYLERMKAVNRDKAKRIIAAAQSGDADAARRVAAQLESNREGRESGFGKAIRRGSEAERQAKEKKENEEAQADREKRATDLAEDLSKQKGGAKVLGEGYDESDVIADLVASGIDEIIARSMAPMVMRKIGEITREKLQGLARQQGKTPQEVRQELIDEQNIKEENDDPKLKTPEEREQARQNKAIAEAEAAWQKWIHDQDTQEEAKKAKAEKEVKRETEKVGGKVASSAAGDFATKAAELALAQNPTQDPEMQAQIAGRAAYQALQGATGPDGQKLTMEQRGAAAKKAADKAVDDVQKRFADAIRQTGDISAANAIVQAEIINELQSLSANLRQVQQQQQRNMRAMQGVRAPMRNNGR